jgi:aryl-alcohol dehydrogenase-like predicted oxidoreductase
MLSRLAIGTANFGQEYGIANQKQLAQEEVFRILESASARGIWGVDTAKEYGHSEKMIGAFFKERGKKLHLITKLPKKEYRNAKEVEAELLGSIQALNVPFIDVLLIHSYETIRRYGKVILPVLESLRREKVIGRYGASVYYPREAEEISHEIKESLAIEFPVNLFDRRFLRTDLLRRLHEEGAALFGRSVFLQGLFFLKEEALIGNLLKAKGRIRQIQEIAKTHEMKVESIALSFVMAQSWIDHVIVGVDCEAHLAVHIQNLAGAEFERYQKIAPLLSELETCDEEIIIPSKWGR